MKQIKSSGKDRRWSEPPALLGILLCLCVFAALQAYAMKDYDNTALKTARVTGKTYAFQADDGERSMALTLEEDGTFRYTAVHGDEADAGSGDWTLVGNYVRLREPDAPNAPVNCLSIWDGYLKYSEDKSSGFPTIEILNGDRFYETETDRS